MMPIDGTLSAAGYGAASTNTLPKQWDELIKYVPELQQCYQGTINVDLNVPVLILNPDRTVPPFEWQPNQVEGFAFARVEFEYPVGGQRRDAWIYLAAHSMHRYNMRRAEVITSHIQDLPQRGNFAGADIGCRLHFPRVHGLII
jgi:hypothetical protein